MSLHLVDHPLSQHLLLQLRDKNTTPELFRAHAKVLSTILVLEATRDLNITERVVETPLENAVGKVLGQGLAVVPVLRAGLAMLESALEIFPDVAVGYIGLERHHDTAIARSYYCKLPSLSGRFTLCFDPMLATGGSASQALSLLKTHQPERLAMVSVIASEDGLAKLEQDHPDVPVIVAGIDPGLNDLKYIVPGLGDFGDRLYGTM